MAPEYNRLTEKELKEDYQRALDEQKKEVRELVMVWYNIFVTERNESEFYGGRQ